MKNLTKYALDGLRITNQELFNKRAYEIISRYDALKLMTDGVPVSVEIIDEAKLTNYIQSKYKNFHEISIDRVTIDEYFEIEVEYSYTYIRYYNNKTDADSKSWNNYKETKNEEYNIPVEFRTSSYYTISKDNIENTGLKIELL